MSFDLLARLPPAVADEVADQIIAGLILIIRQHRDIVHSQTEWNVVLSLLRSTISHPEASRLTFDLLTELVSDGSQQQVTPDNFVGLVSVLEEFVMAASVVVEAQQQGRRTQALTAVK